MPVCLRAAAGIRPLLEAQPAVRCRVNDALIHLAHFSVPEKTAGSRDVSSGPAVANQLTDSCFSDQTSRERQPQRLQGRKVVRPVGAGTLRDQEANLRGGRRIHHGAFLVFRAMRAIAASLA